MKKQNEFREFMGLLAHRYPFLLTEKELSEDFKQIFHVIKRISLLKRTDNEKYVICPGDDQACLREVFLRSGKKQLYVNCECNEQDSVFKIDDSDLLRYEFDLQEFLNWLAKECRLKESAQEIEKEKVWFIGSKSWGEKTINIYFLRTDDFKAAEILDNTITKVNRVCFWLGEPPHTSNLSDHLISIPDVLKIRGNDLVLIKSRVNKLLLNKDVVTGGILLDAYIKVKKEINKHYLCFLQDGGLVKKIIRPQAYQIIEHLYMIRRSDNARQTAAGIARELGNRIKAKTVLTRMGEVNRICKELGVKLVFKAYGDEEWGLNDKLSGFSR